MVPALGLLPPPMRSKPETTKVWATAGSRVMAWRISSPVAAVRFRVAPSGSIKAEIR